MDQTLQKLISTVAIIFGRKTWVLKKSCLTQWEYCYHMTYKNPETFHLLLLSLSLPSLQNALMQHDLHKI